MPVPPDLQLILASPFPSCVSFGAIPGGESPCPRCRKEARRLQALHEAILSIREAQQELHRWATLIVCIQALGQRVRETW